MNVHTSNFHRIVDDIRLALNSPPPLDVPMFAELLAQYAEACEIANERLRRAGQLLHKGLRSEAIQFGEQEPNLLDLVGLLDFAERPQLSHVAQQFQLALPPPILMDLADQLNAAYSQTEQLSRLLKHHRLLALARAPLAARIGVLRRMHAADGANPVWSDDLRTLERARMRQLQGDITKAYQFENLPELTRLVKEVRAPHWIEPPSPEVGRIAEELHQKIAAKCARADLERLLPHLEAAYSAFDVGVARQLRLQWDASAAIAQLTPEAPLLQRAEPALEWVSQQDAQEARARQFEQSLLAVTAALDNDLSRAELERRYHAALRFEESIPGPLVQRVRSRIAEHDLRSRRRATLALLAVVGGLALSAGIVVWVIRQQTHSRNVAAATQSFSKLVESEQLAEAAQFFEELEQRSPRLAKEIPLQEWKGRLDGLVSAERKRKQSFDEALQIATEAGAQTPDVASLERARELAKFEGEKQVIARLDREISAARRETQRARDEQFRSELRELQQRLTELENTEPQNEAQFQSASALLLNDIRQSLKQSFVSELLRSQAEPLQARVEVLRANWNAERRERDARNGITDLVGSLSQFRQALQHYVEQFPESVRSKDFQRALEEAGLWEGHLAWRGFLSRPALQRPHTLDSVAATKLLQEAEPLLEKYGKSPVADDFKALSLYLKKMGERREPDGTFLIDRVRKLFADPLVANLYIVELKNGDRYYLRDEAPDPAKPNSIGKVEFKHLEGFELNPPRLPKKLVDPGEVAIHGEAPQSRLSHKILNGLTGFDEVDWDREMVAIVDAVATEPRIDPVLQLVLLRKVLEIGSKGSLRFEAAFAPRARVIQATGLNLGVNWIDPENGSAKPVRKEAAEIVKRFREMPLGSPPPIAPPEIPAAWHGWLARGRKGSWECLHPKPLPDGRLLILTGGNVEPVQYTTIGKVTNDRVEWEHLSPGATLEGRLIFVRPD